MMKFDEYKEGQYLGIIDKKKVYVFRFVRICDEPNNDYGMSKHMIINISELKEIGEEKIMDKKE